MGDMHRVRSEHLTPEPSIIRLAAADVLVREEPDEDEDDDHNGEEDDDSDDDEGYSE